ncbi:MAG: hypothetical protein RLZZ300_894 [Pseudomonadota bacterium]|jgi:uncharacterized protein (UPF0332 family)|nr:HEPN domain-containing protein [Azonexus sp.]
MNAQSLMTKARIACESARALLERQDSDGACNRAYYAMFDAARAALMATNAEIPLNIGKTHSGVLTAFSQHLVKNGPVPRDIGRLLKQAEELRLVADYSGDSITLDDARALVEKAESFVDTLASILDAPPTANGA